MLYRLVAKDGQNGKVDLSDMFYEVNNGCICCAVKDELVLTLERLLQQKGDDIDHIIIETSGLADPSPIIQSFWLDNELESRIYLNGVITLVDLKNISTHLDLAPGTGSSPDSSVSQLHALARKQLCYADVVLLNKIDLLMPVESNEMYHLIQAKIRQLNPFVTMHPTQFRKHDSSEESTSQVPPLKPLLSINSYSSAVEKLDLLKADPGKLDDLNNHEVHDDKVTSLLVQWDEPVQEVTFKTWLGELLWEKCDSSGAELYRIKGILNIKDSDKQFVVQAVADTFEIYPTNEQWPEDPVKHRQSKVIFIGKHLDNLDLHYQRR